MTEYSKDLTEAMKTFLESLDGNYDFDEEEGIFRFGILLRNKIKRIMFYVGVGSYSYNMSAFLEDLEIAEKDVSAISEYLCRINAWYYCACFKLGLGERLVRCCNCVICNGIMPNNEFIAENIHNICYGVENYADGLIDIIEGKGTPKQIYEKYVKELA